MRPFFDFTAIDFFINKNSLRKLFSFISNKMIDSFRIDLHMMRSTFVMIRHERSMRQIIHESKNSNGEHTFETVFTTFEKGVESSFDHHRIINYVLSDVNCVVQFEVAAWYETEKTSTFISFVLDENFFSFITNVSLNESASQKHVLFASMNFSVIQHGRNITSSKLAEIKIRGLNSLQMNKFMSQFWLDRTSYLLVDMHEKDSDVFNRMKTVDAAAKFPKWKKQNQNSLRILSNLIAELKKISKQTDDDSCIITCDYIIKPLWLKIFGSFKKDKKFNLFEEFIHMFWKNDAEWIVWIL